MSLVFNLLHHFLKRTEVLTLLAYLYQLATLTV